MSYRLIVSTLWSSLSGFNRHNRLVSRRERCTAIRSLMLTRDARTTAVQHKSSVKPIMSFDTVSLKALVPLSHTRINSLGLCVSNVSRAQALSGVSASLLTPCRVRVPESTYLGTEPSQRLAIVSVE
jgi:hypothetical protein